MGRREARWVGVLLALTIATALSVVFVDRPAATFAHETFHGATVFIAMTHLVDPALPVSVVGVLVIGIASLVGWVPPPAVRLIFTVCLATLLVSVLKDQLKFAFGRTWPETWVDNNPSWIRDGAAGFTPFHGGRGWASFPSGHTALMTAPMEALILMLRQPWRWLFVIPIGVVMVGLWGADYHYIGDMLAGILVGLVAAAVVVAAPGTRPLDEVSRL